MHHASVSGEHRAYVRRVDSSGSGEPAAPRRQSLLRSQARCALLPAATPREGPSAAADEATALELWAGYSGPTFRGKKPRGRRQLLAALPKDARSEPVDGFRADPFRAHPRGPDAPLRGADGDSRRCPGTLACGAACGSWAVWLRAQAPGGGGPSRAAPRRLAALRARSVG